MATAEASKARLALSTKFRLRWPAGLQGVVAAVSSLTAPGDRALGMECTVSASDEWPWGGDVQRVATSLIVLPVAWTLMIAAFWGVW